MAEIVWWEVETPGPERFQRFHAALSGWSFEPAFADTDLGADYWVIRHEGQGIGGLQRSAPDAALPSAGVRIYLAVDDLEATLEHVVSLGGVVERPRVALGGDDRWFALFRDPAGVSFGLWTKHPGRGLSGLGQSPARSGVQERARFHG